MRHALLTNDDGINAPGLRALAEAFLADGWRVTVSAPDGERSGSSHSITIKRPLVVCPVRWDGVEDGGRLRVWRVDGAPCDCAKVALLELCDGRPDVAVSGINSGWNVGTDIHYSGTFGGAMEAAFEGVPAIAVSQQRPDPARYANAARLAVGLAARLAESPLPVPAVLNLNTPDCPPEGMLGVVEAPLTLLRYSDHYHKLPHTRGRAAFWLSGEVSEECRAPGGDLDMLRRGYATVTAVGWDMTLRGACAGLLRE